jgi:outer membrane biogenesis lipoprotein LolB
MRTTMLLLLVGLLLSGCAFHPKRPKTYTPAPSVNSAQRGVEDAKDYNSQINNELDALEKELR